MLIWMSGSLKPPCNWKSVLTSDLCTFYRHVCALVLSDPSGINLKHQLRFSNSCYHFVLGKMSVESIMAWEANYCESEYDFILDCPITRSKHSIIDNNEQMFCRMIEAMRERFISVGISDFSPQSFNGRKPFTTVCKLHVDTRTTMNHASISSSPVAPLPFTLGEGLKRVHKLSYCSISINCSAPHLPVQEPGADILIIHVWLGQSMRVSGGEMRRKRRSWRSEGCVCVIWGGDDSSHN